MLIQLLLDATVIVCVDAGLIRPRKPKRTHCSGAGLGHYENRTVDLIRLDYRARMCKI